MENQLRGIGEVARRSGLSVSALRWYDENKVLVPAVVDPLSGYRWYAPDQIRSARIVARLRRVGLPVAAMRQVLADPAAAPALLDAHLVRLEQGLADARRELSAALTLLEQPPRSRPRRCRHPAHRHLAALATALRAVRFAAGTDPSEPAWRACCSTSGRGPRATVVATDRYRLAVAPVEGARVEGPAVAALLPAGWVDEVVDRLDAAADGGEAELDGDGRRGRRPGAGRRADVRAARRRLPRLPPARPRPQPRRARAAGVAARRARRCGRARRPARARAPPGRRQPRGGPAGATGRRRRRLEPSPSTVRSPSIASTCSRRSRRAATVRSRWRSTGR